MKLIQELVNQAALAKSDGSDAGTNDLDGKGAEVSFDLMRNTINSDGKIKGSDVANYLERAHELNDEIETVLYGLETSDGDVVKVYVNATQADAFESEMKKMLGMEDDIEEAINALATKFDIVDVIWPAGSKVDGEDGDKEDEVDLDSAADIGAPDDDDMETIASVDDEEAAAAAPSSDDDDDDDDAPTGDAPKKDKKPEGGKKPAGDEEEAGEEEPAGDETPAGDEAPTDKKDDKKDDKKKDKKPKKDDKHSLLKSIGGGLAGKSKVTEGEVIKADFSKGKGVDNPGIEVPKGYDRFEVDGKKIIGIKGDSKKVISATSDERLAQELVKIYNGGKASVSIKPMSLLQAFGSNALAAADTVGIKLTEKPSYWEDFEGGGYAAKHNIDEVKLKKLERAAGKLTTYAGHDLFGEDRFGSDKPKGPLVKPRFMPKEDMFIVQFNDGTRYVADQTGASTYIRMWQKIN